MVKITQTQYFQYIAFKSNMILVEPPTKIMEIYSDIIQFQLNHVYILEETASLEYLNDLFLRINKIIIYIEFQLSIEETPIYVFNPMTRTEIINEFIPYIHFDEDCIPDYQITLSKLRMLSNIITRITIGISTINEQITQLQIMAS